jgi:glycosyltransferase involved in cell wall biosynthesis
MNDPIDSVTVVIPTKGRNHLLARAVTSVLGQDWPHVNVIVVDNNSEDQCVKVAFGKSEWFNDRRVSILENRTAVNAACARNLALDTIHTKWVTYLDDDDEYRPQKVRQQLTICCEKGVPLVLCGYRRNAQFRSCDRQTHTNSYRGVELYRDAHPGTPFLFHRYGDQLRFDETLDAHEDADFFYRAVEYFGLNEVYVAAEPLVIVHQQLTQRVNTQSEASCRAHRRIYYRHYRKLERPVRRSLVVRMLLSRWKQDGRTGSLWKISFWLWKSEHVRMFRLVANAILFRVPFLRRFAIS